jgi:hypothetical protein
MDDILAKEKLVHVNAARILALLPTGLSMSPEEHHQGLCVAACGGPARGPSRGRPGLSTIQHSLDLGRPPARTRKTLRTSLVDQGEQHFAHRQALGAQRGDGGSRSRRRNPTEAGLRLMLLDGYGPATTRGAVRY